jgi:hypothetical protein
MDDDEKEERLEEEREYDIMFIQTESAYWIKLNQWTHNISH